MAGRHVIKQELPFSIILLGSNNKKIYMKMQLEHSVFCIFYKTRTTL